MWSKANAMNSPLNPWTTRQERLILVSSEDFSELKPPGAARFAVAGHFLRDS
jgi:hypothetical protein